MNDSTVLEVLKEIRDSLPQRLEEWREESLKGIAASLKQHDEWKKAQTRSEDQKDDYLRAVKHQSATLAWIHIGPSNPLSVISVFRFVPEVPFCVAC